ncbi:MCE family protein [Pseudonocardiaceae bacterium YIM PH 21723]|nr:MCE family protein [Pseudonocardiaceae bacterium YIM PH 21723]
MTVRRTLAACCAILLVCGLVVVWPHGQRLAVTADFERAVNLHAGDEVRVLGVPVGSVTEVSAQPDRVTVRMEVDRKQSIPAGAQAVIVAPSLVSGRYVALTPVYTGGPVLAEGAVIPRERTRVPIDWDQLQGSITQLTDALGSTGSASRAVDVAHANLTGQGRQLHDTMAQLAAAADTLANSRGDLFGTVRNLQVFVEALNSGDAQIREFGNQFSAAATFLNAHREQLGGTLAKVAATLGTLRQFLADHQNQLTANARSLTELTGQLAADRDQLAEVLHTGPVALSNLYNIYDPQRLGFRARPMLVGLQNVAGLVCTALYALGGTQQQCRDVLEPLLGPLNLPIKLNFLPQPAARPSTLPGLLLGGGR